VPSVEYRLFFNNTAATREQLDRVDEITVEQEMDMAWEAQIQVPICTDERGQWSSQDEAFLREFSRVRVEIKVGKGGFLPLIDGPIVEVQDQLNSQPGESLKTIRVQDDSVYLNREDEIVRHENQLDHEIAQQLLQGVEQIASIDVETTPSPTSSLPPVVMQRETRMQLLRSFARRHPDFHAYVLPGTESGASIGCFKKFPEQLDGLPDLVLLGGDRNLSTFTPQYDAQSPATASTAFLSLTDRTVTQRQADPATVTPLGGSLASPRTTTPATRILPPSYGDGMDVDQAVNTSTTVSSFAYGATGQVLGECYSGVLSPYRLITVRGANELLSGTYQITRVSHSLTRSNYAQSFTLRRNSRSDRPPANNNSGGVGAIAAASVTVSFNIQGSIF